MKYWKGLTLAAVVGGLAVFGLSTDALSQAVPDQPIQGTIPVEEGADYAALATVTPEQARDAALAHVPGATFDDSELEEENGFLVYDIELNENGQEVEVSVDAGDASILEVDRDDDSDDDDSDDD